jgi:hypothetical protein
MAFNKPALTIGMAHHTDFYGVYFTLQALRKELRHYGLLDQVEFVVIDNSPDNEHGLAVRQSFEVGWVGHGAAGQQYIRWDEYDSTSQSRNQIFVNAKADYVLAMDCHVLMEIGAVGRLIDYYKKHPKTKDLLTGPLDFDDLEHQSTHFDDQWGGEMRGRWGQAWQCACDDGIRFGVIVDQQTPGASPKVKYQSLELDGKYLASCYKCKKNLPVEQDFHQHEIVLASMGFRRLGFGDETLTGRDRFMDRLDQPPFEIPGQGLGMFSCRTDSWVGFNPHARGFGAEEMCVHEAVKQNGGVTLCCPFMPWVHRFRRVGGTPYKLTVFNKARNYVLWYNQLDRNTDELKTEFVREGGVSDTDWNMLMADPVSHVEPVDGADCQTCGGAVDDGASALDSIEAVFDHCQSRPRDLDQHMKTLRDLAMKVDRITEFTARRESTVAFAAGLSQKGAALTSYQSENDTVLAKLNGLLPSDKSVTVHRCDNSDSIATIEETDLLFLDTEHTYDKLSEELRKFGPSTKRFIVCHDTAEFGESGTDGRPAFGLMTAIRDYCKDHREWSVIRHDMHQYGLTVLGRQKQDKPKLPSKTKQLLNFARHMKDHVMSGAQYVDAAELKRRTDICATCTMRVDDKCAACGCPIDKKAPMKALFCELGYWDQPAEVATKKTDSHKCSGACKKKKPAKKAAPKKKPATPSRKNPKRKRTRTA